MMHIYRIQIIRHILYYIIFLVYCILYYYIYIYVILKISNATLCYLFYIFCCDI